MTTLVREKIMNKIPGMAGAPAPAAGESAASQFLKLIATKEKPEVLEMLGTREIGLDENETEEKLSELGPNEVIQEQAAPWYMQLLAAFANPFIIVLLVLATISFITDVVLQSPEGRDYKTVIVITILVLTSTLITFVQEYRSNKAADKLKAMVRTTATVIRQSTGKRELDITEIVPGDIILLSAGDMIPADMRVLQSKDLFVSQAMLTGESLPVEKKEFAVPDALTRTVLELENICFMGTNVVSGTAVAVVANTANRTYFGSIAKAISGKRAETSFDKGINSVSWLLIRFMLVMVPLVFVINGFSKEDGWMNAFMFALSVAVGLTPAMLPMVVTGNLAKGAVNMSKRKVVVKRLNAIQNIGAMDVLCTDKTGTLTLDKIVLERYLNVYGNDDDEVLTWAYLNSYHQTGLKSLLDVAVLEHLELRSELKVDEYVKVDEIPFDFHRRRMSVILEQKDDKHLLICKGAVEEMLDICSHAIDPGEESTIGFGTNEIIKLDEAVKEKIINITRKLNEDGLRVLLVAIKEYEERPLTYTIADESNMILTGFVGFLDPPKPSAKESIAALQKLGISVKVLTGDNEVVTKKICKQVGIPVTNIIMGNDLEFMSDEDLSAQIDNVSILAKLSPVQKSRVVKVLQAKGHTVGFLGDGINDAAALRDADVGISVDTAVDIAKESADIILLENDLMVIRKGVIYGRRTFGNIIKYIKMAVSGNFGNMFSVLGASIFLPFLPMLPLHILVQNLLYDVSQISIPWDEMDREYIDTPHKWNPSGIARFMFFIGPISSIFDYALFAVMYFVFSANTVEEQTLFQSGWFIEGLLSQTLIIHMIRTRKIPFIQSWATAPVVALTSLIMVIGICIPFSPFAAALKLQPLPLAYFPWLICILVAYCILTQAVKTWFIRRFGEWL